ncbi:MAG: DUF2806 domain-containing protein [Pirellula sp.]
MTEIKDLAGLSQPLTRLIEVVAAGIGAVSASFLIKRNSDARAHEFKVVGNAMQEVTGNRNMQASYKDGRFEISSGATEIGTNIGSESVEHRAAARMGFQETKRQACIESISTIAAAELSQESVVAEEKPLDEWITRFFSIAQDVSSSQLQDLWGRLLAGEVKQPGSYSLRTLDFVRDISSADAALFQKLGVLSITTSGGTFIPIHDKDWLRQRGVNTKDRVELSDLGLLHPNDLSINFTGQDKAVDVTFINGGNIIHCVDTIDASKFNLPIWKFTKIGEELLSLVRIEYDEEYLNHVASVFVSLGYKVRIGRIVEKYPNGKLKYDVIKTLGEPS